jgi:Sec-independent protein translocase protein TatA
MTILTSIILVLVIVAGTAGLAYYMQRGTKAMSEFKADFDNNKEAQELADLAKELYNKDLRPIVAKKAPKKEKVEEVPEGIVEEPAKKETKPEFPIDKPKKKRKYYPKKK